jgi:hypothetical protein
MITEDYIICDLEELDEEPSVYMKNPYRIEPLTYWEHNEDDSHTPQPQSVFLNKIIEKVTHEGKEIVTTQYNYAVLSQYPQFTNDTDILFNSNRIMTVFDPTPEILNLYTQLISK